MPELRKRRSFRKNDVKTPFAPRNTIHHLTEPFRDHAPPRHLPLKRTRIFRMNPLQLPVQLTVIALPCLVCTHGIIIAPTPPNPTPKKE